MSKPVVLVTGASKGIGFAVTKSLLEEHNANVVALSRSRTPELDILIEAHRCSLLAIPCDVTDEEAQAHAFSLAKDKFGPVLNGLVLNAGILDPLARISDSTVALDAWKRHFDVNFFSLIIALKVALPALRSNPSTGRVIFISSGAATGGIPGWAAYNAGKAAMNSLARTLANEEPTIISLAFAPGKVDTAMQETLRSAGAAHMDESDHNIFIDAYREGTLVKPFDVAYVIANLSLHASSSLSGSFVRYNDEHCKEFGRK
ncbi:NAD(P)-binding protein [Gyrodon lividus]|nr:NAD(P)-binding protein [Gyrodon lividus]